MAFNALFIFLYRFFEFLERAKDRERDEDQVNG